MVYELNGRKNICIIGNVITLQIILRNEIPGNNNLLKVTSTEIEVWLIFVKSKSKLKRSSISKIHGACSNTNLTLCLLCYEPWHIRNSDLFILLRIFRTLESSKV